jgi:hypothetical protein
MAVCQVRRRPVRLTGGLWLNWFSRRTMRCDRAPLDASSEDPWLSMRAELQSTLAHHDVPQRVAPPPSGHRTSVQGCPRRAAGQRSLCSPETDRQIGGAVIDVVKAKLTSGGVVAAGTSGVSADRPMVAARTTRRSFKSFPLDR